MDLRGAFDSVDRIVLMETMRKRGVREGLVESIKEMLRKSRVRVGGGQMG